MLLETAEISNYSNLYSSQQWTKIPFAPYPPQIYAIRFKFFAQCGSDCDLHVSYVTEIEHISLCLLAVWIFFFCNMPYFLLCDSILKWRHVSYFCLVFCSFMFVKLYSFLDTFHVCTLGWPFSFYNIIWEWHSLFFKWSEQCKINHSSSSLHLEDYT